MAGGHGALSLPAVRGGGWVAILGHLCRMPLHRGRPPPVPVRRARVPPNGGSHLGQSSGEVAGKESDSRL
eukprot:15096283-Alexandrium_andersonii.AAC.1